MTDNQLESNHHVSVLGINMSDEFARAVVDEVMAEYHQDDKPSVKQLKYAIRKNLIIPGFRSGSAHKANPGQIRSFLASHWNHIPPITKAVAEIWGELHPELVSRCRAWWLEQGNSKLELHLLREDDDQSNIVRFPEELVNELQKEFADIATPDELGIAMFLASSQADQDAEPDNEVKSIGIEETDQPPATADIPLKSNVDPLGSRWEGILDLIRQFPAEDPCWTEINSFIDSVNSIAGEKSKEQETQDRIDSLSALWTQSRPVLVEKSDYFEIPGVENWSIDAVMPVDIDDITNKIQDLVQRLQELNRLEQKPLPKTRAERLKRDKKRLETEEEIQGLYHALDDKLTPTDDHPVDEKTSSSNVQNPEEIASEIELPAGKDEDSDLLIEAENAGEVEEASPNIVVSQPEQEKPADSVVPNQTAEDESPIREEPLPVPLESTGESDAGQALQSNGTALEEENEIPMQEEIFSEPEESTGESDTVQPRSSDRAETEKEASPEPKAVDTKQPGQSYDAVEKSPNEIILERLKNRDLSNAYWLAWSLEEQGKGSLLPSYLIAALQGAIWSMGLWSEQPVDFLASISALVRPSRQSFSEEYEASKLLRLCAGIYYNLVDPLGGWSTWMEAESIPNISFGKLTSLVLEAVTKGVYLEPDLVQVIVNAEQVEESIVTLSEEVKQWCLNSTNKSAKFYRSGQVWLELVRQPNGELYQLIEVVANDRRKKAKALEQQLKNWQDRSWLEKHLQQIDRDIRQKKGNPIVGNARDQIMGWIQDICEVALKWCRIVQVQEDAKKGHDWKLEQTGLLCENLNAAIKSMQSDLAELNERDPEPTMAAAYLIADWTLEGLLALVSTPGDSSPDTWPRPQGIEALEKVGEHLTLSECLARALIQYPELELEDNGMPDLTASKDMASILTNVINRTPEQAIKDWITKRDYRFVGSLWNDTQDPEIWQTRIREAIRSDVSSLNQKEVDDTAVAVEQALLEGIIAEEEHSEFNSRIESIRKQIRQTEKDGFAKISIIKLSGRLQLIRKELDTKRQDRLKSHKAHWQKVESKIPGLLGDNREFFELIKTVVESGIAEYDLRALGEYLSHLDQALASGEIPEKTLFESQSSPESDSLQDFQDLLPNIVTLLEPRSQWSINKIRNAIVSDEPLPKFPMKSLPKPRRVEVSSALDAWRRLKADGPDNTQSHLKNIQILMEYLGFTLSSPSPISIKTHPGSLPNFQYWRVTASANNFSPVAQFGSQRNGYYDVLGVWDRPGFEIIGSQVSSLMKQTGNQPTILFYFHYLTPAKRDHLLSNTRKNRLPMLVVDEGLILYLAREHDTRIKPMFQCALPYAALNPYFPSAAGLVPPEMYKGRHELVRNLINPYGPAIVYGGRQLGKSALLRQVQREFHHPENGQYVIYEDIKSVGDPVSGKFYQAEFRDRFAQALVNLKLIEPQRITLDIDRLFNHLQQNVLIHDKRLLLLLDETDHFLDADADKNFYIVHKLKSLMDQTGRKFKIVLTGLHNVQRFQRISNQPLAHLGTPIEIGPLDPKSARDLLVDPLHALGYCFGQSKEKEDNSLVLHILSYTNYHPGLIQLFGSYLYEHLLSKYQQPVRPPLSITRADVEAVYRKKEVRDAICDRFNWTLALDPRYEAITLALILEQWDDQNGFDQLYTPRQLRALASTWWPEAFGEEITPERLKSFLDEMRGLGVLSAHVDGNRYRLRSPNLVYLMGTYDQICDRLDSLSKTTPPGERAMESYHAQIDTGIYSPLTFAHERALNDPRSGVALIFGSNAVGINTLDNALRRLLPEETGAWQEIRIRSRGDNAILQQLKTFEKENPKANFLIAYRSLDECDWMKMVEEVSAAIQFCNGISRKKTIRVVFGMDPLAAWQWHQIPREQREALEEKVVVNLLKRWDQVGIRQRLDMESGNGSEIITSERMLPQVVEITGGWPILLDEFISHCKKSEPGPSLNRINEDISDHQSVLSQSFISSIRIYDKLSLKLIGILQEQNIQEMLKQEPSYLEVLQLALEDQPVELIENTVEYLRRLSVVSSEPDLHLEPAFARAWHVS